MNTLFILNDPPYGSERSYNALRLAGALARQGSSHLRVFLMGDAAACAKRGQVTPQGFYNVERMLRGVTGKHVPVSVCGTCMDARGLAEADLVDGATRGTLDQLGQWTSWAEKIVVF